MKMLHINVINKIAIYQQRDGDIVCGNSDYSIQFSFDEEWATHTEKTARFIWGNEYTEVDFSGDVCPVPIMTNVDTLMVGVYAGELYTTTPATIGCKRSILCLGGVPTDQDTHFTSAAKEAAISASESAQLSAAYAQSIKKDSVNMNARISRNDKRITNLEQGIPPELFETDSSVAHVKAVPPSALPYAEITQIGGLTRKCANLLPIPDGYTFTTTADGANNNPTLLKNFYVESGSVTISFDITAGSSNTRNAPRLRFRDETVGADVYFGISENLNKDAGHYSYTAIVTENGYYDLMWWDNGNTVKQTISRIMLNYGDTALPFEAYYDGLRSAKATELKSAGGNMIDFSKGADSFTENGVTFTNNGDGSFTVNGTATAQATYYIHHIAKGNFLQLKENVNYTISGNAIKGKVGVAVYDENWKYNNSISEAKKVFTVADGSLKYGVYLYTLSGVTYENVTVYPMLNIGADAAPFKPYKDTVDIFHIPAEIQALDGYGDGINESCYNYVDYEKKQFIKRVGKVDMGTLDWVVDLGTCLYSANLNCKYLGNVLCVGYETVFDDSLLLSGTWDIICAGNGYIGLTNTSNDEAETFKSAMSGNMLYYELAEPIVTDISDLISEDNFIAVEGGGTITAVNEHNFAVPSEITYMLKEEAV